MNKGMGLPSKFKLSTPYSHSNDVYESHKYDYEVPSSSYLKKKKTFSHDPKQVTHKIILEKKSLQYKALNKSNVSYPYKKRKERKETSFES